MFTTYHVPPLRTSGVRPLEVLLAGIRRSVASVINRIGASRKVNGACGQHRACSKLVNAG